MQDNYNKDLENKGWAKMSALLDEERPVAIPFWKRAWRKFALGLMLLVGILSAYVFFNLEDKVTIAAVSQSSEVVDYKENRTSASINTQGVTAIIEETTNIATTYSITSKTEKNTSKETSIGSPLKPTKSNRFNESKITSNVDLLNTKSTAAEEGQFNPLWLINNNGENNPEVIPKEKENPEEVPTKEPIAILEALAPKTNLLTYNRFVVLEKPTNNAKFKPIENFIISYDNGYDFGLKNYSSAIFAGVDMPLKNKKWTFRPSLGYNSMRSQIIVDQVNPEGSQVAINEPITTAEDISVYIANISSTADLADFDKGASFFTSYRINELQLQLKMAYRLNDKLSLFGGVTPTYLLNNTKGILPTFQSDIVRLDEGNFSQRATLGQANRVNLNGLMGIDYQIVPKLSLSAAYNHGWVKKAQTDLVDTKLRSVNLSLNYHF